MSRKIEDFANRLKVPPMLSQLLATTGIWTVTSLFFVWRLGRYAVRRGLTPEPLPFEFRFQS